MPARKKKSAPKKLNRIARSKKPVRRISVASKEAAPVEKIEEPAPPPRKINQFMRLPRRRLEEDGEDSLPVPPPPPNPDATAAGIAREIAAKGNLPEAPLERARYDGDTAYKLYLREIGQVGLLTPQQEVDLASLIKKGDKEARELMIKANLRLVVKIARDYEGFGLPLLDLVSEGNIGLMKAVERFDPAKGGKLSTYAAWWIKQSIKRALANQSKTIRLPVHLVDKIAKMRRSEMKLHEELGREPTNEELAAELDTTPQRIAQMRSASIRPASLDAPIGDEDSNTYGEIVEDEAADTPYEQLEEKTVTDMLHDLVETLDQREITILRYRFGLDGGPERTLEEVGEKFGVTRERIRQIQNIALRKLRKRIEKIEAKKI
jgi:RNA polymerase primary sigma factor